MKDEEILLKLVFVWGLHDDQRRRYGGCSNFWAIYGGLRYINTGFRNNIVLNIVD